METAGDGLCNANDKHSRNLYQKLVPEKLVTVSGTYDMQSCIDFFLVPDSGIGSVVTIEIIISI